MPTPEFTFNEKSPKNLLHLAKFDTRLASEAGEGAANGVANFFHLFARLDDAEFIF